MGKPPSVIIIARHGARLDAVDKQWHLTSATPYDPPLTYGGWNQSRALGARIVSLLHAREEASSGSPCAAVSQAGDGSATENISHIPPSNSQDNLPSSHETRNPRRKHKVFIHTSPYLRCLQTAIGVSAGISQHYHGADTAQQHLGSSSIPVTAPTVVDGPGNSPDQPDQEKETTSGTSTPNSRSSHGGKHCLLRVDPFLGEWLSPDYFDEITPPPNSERMMAGAKAELLRRGEGINATAEMNGKPLSGNFPGGWGSVASPVSPDSDEGGRLGKTTAMSFALGRGRAENHDVGLNPVKNPRAPCVLTKINTDLDSMPDGGYVPPTPGYAISSSDPIPAGYVAHARDACTRIDYQWDSMREPQHWGDGGVYGEEWSAMHMRFRNGLQKMVDWYRVHDNPDEGIHHNHHRSPSNGSTQSQHDEDDYTDTVLVLITHGAGCNALIGAVTGQPVLLDIGMASITMAVRKDTAESVASSSCSSTDSNHLEQRRTSPVSLSLSQEYELQVVVSADHLRAGVNPAQLPLHAPSPSPSTLSSPSISSYRHRFGSRPSSLSNNQFMIGPSLPKSSSTRTWSTARPSTAPRGASGLWGSISAISDLPETIEDIVPNFGDPRPISSTKSLDGDSGSGTASASDSTWPTQLPQRTMSQRGLWGSAALMHDREPPTKRRWTVTERRP